MNEQERDKEWLGELRVVDLVDMSYGTFDLSQGSTKEWWERIQEIPMDLKDIKREDLVAELVRRDRLKPVKISPLEIEINPLVKICEDYIDAVWDKEYIDKDFPHWIFETAMQCVFGEKIFDKINQRSKHAINDR